MPRVGDYFILDTAFAEEMRKRAEHERIRKARNRYDYESRKRGRSHHGAKESPYDKYHMATMDKPFVAWDGEGPRDTGYSLFGNSLGSKICHPYLETAECLDLVLDCEKENPSAIHIWFGGNYDTSMILRQLPWRLLSALHHFGKCVWRDYEIEHIPHKWLRIKRGKLVAKIFDIRSYFGTDYVGALDDFGIGTPEQREKIRLEKRRRSDFLWKEIYSIEEYWALELSLMPLLAEKLRHVFFDAGYMPRSWHGPGALARMALQRHKIYECMATTPIDVRIASQYAFAGGRFESVLAGHVRRKVYVADINSAYPYYATQLPNLAKGKWRHGRNYEAGKFAIYHIRYRARPEPYRIYPLFRRLEDGQVVWPYKVTGWYWAPEAALVANDPDAEFVESLVFDEDDVNDRPFRFLYEYYDKRKRLKALGNAAEYTFKLIINSIYGQLAQRTGWDRKGRHAPRSHQLEWAGYITSGCRAAIYKLARQCGSNLVSIDTDGITSLQPIDIGKSDLVCGDRLGEIKLEEWDDGIFWQSGIYSLRKDGEWKKGKTRGIPKGSYTADDLLGALYAHKSLQLTKKVFVTYGLADSGRKSEHNLWLSEPHEFVLGGAGKRIHIESECKRNCISPYLHRLAQMHGHYINDEESIPHYLPWLDRRLDRLTEKKMIMDDLTFYDANDLDPDDEWILEVA